MKRLIVCLMALMMLVFTVPLAYAAEFYVSVTGSNVTGDGTLNNPWRTVQYGINQIYVKDAVLHVLPGTYNEQVVVNMIAEGLQLLGSGANVTTIDASSIVKNGGVIKLPPVGGFLISGFTLTGGTYEGSGSPGGAIRGKDATGFNESAASATVENNIIINNYSYGYQYTGGGITLGPNCIIRNNIFIDNSSRYGSGAVYVGRGSIIEDNIFDGNDSSEGYNWGAGAVATYDVSIIIRGNSFLNNRSGAGSSGRGGAFRGEATLYNNLFVGNSTQGYNSGDGGAAYISNGTFINNTLVDNIGDTRGEASGVYIDGPVVLVNNIIVGGTGGVGLYVASGATVTANYNNIWNNDLGAYGGYAVPGANDIHVNPLFVNTAGDDYHLQEGSLCIDVGDNNVPGLPDIDKDGNPRIIGSAVDIGAYEYQNVVLFSTPDIKANGSDGPVTITQSDNLSVTAALDDGDMSGDNADWWVVADTPFGWYYYNLVSGWLPGMKVTYQGPLFDLSAYEVLNMSGLPVGSYTFYFGVDMIMNGSLDMGQIYYDSVEVNVTP